VPFINRVPKGLLGLLDLKTQGDNPPQLVAGVQPSIELRDFYAQSTRDTLSAAVAVGALGQFSPAALVVPQGELWLVYGMSATMSAPPIAGAATIALSIGVCPAEASSRFIGFENMDRVGVAGEDIALGWSGCYWFGPGDQPSFWVTTFTGAPGGVRLTLQRSRFLI
jgi:hypothetical protein